MRSQLSHIREAVHRPNISVRVIPHTAGANGTLTGSFSIFSFPGEDEPDVAFTETVGSTLLTDGARDVRRLNRLFRSLASVALTDEESIELIQRVDKEQV